MPINFNSLLRSVNVEKNHKDFLVNKQDIASSRIYPQAPLVMTAAALILGLGTPRLMFDQREQLEDHPMCGVPTGGKVNGN